MNDKYYKEIKSMKQPFNNSIKTSMTPTKKQLSKSNNRS